MRRGATCARWSHDDKYFDVGSAEGLVSICTYEAGEDWWSSKHLKTTDGSVVLALDWHPNGACVAISTLDRCVHLLTVHFRNTASSAGIPQWMDASLAKTFDEAVKKCEFDSWVHDLSFSPNGLLLALAVHDGVMRVINITKDS